MNTSIRDNNILSRFEDKTKGTKTKLYTVEFEGGKRCSMVCLNGESKEQASSSCNDRFGSKFLGVSEL